MSVEDLDRIDFLGIETGTGDVVLTVSDHLPWDPLAPHVWALQEKLNAYLRFVEGGELAGFPAAAGRAVVIEIVMREAPSAAGSAFVAQAASAIEGAGLTLRWRVLPEDG